MGIKRIFLRYPEVIFLALAGFFTRLWALSSPATVVFDEAHFVLYATKYITGQFYFDIHPPLGKMVLGLVAWIAGVTPGFDFQTGISYPDTTPYLALRIVPALFGALLVPLAYLIARELYLSRKVSFLVGLFVLLDNALLVHSRIVLLDSIMLFLILLSLYFLLRFLSSRNWTLLFFSGVVAGLAGSIKWIGFAVLAVAWVYFIFWERLHRQSSKKQLPYLLFLLCVPLAMYVSIFTVHLALVDEPCLQSCGSVLEDRGDIFNIPSQGNMIQQFFHQHWYMASSTVFAGESDFPFSSRWYAWPFMHKGFYYAAEESGDRSSSIFLTGNPAVWYLSSIGIIGLILISVGSAFQRRKGFSLFSSPGVFIVVVAYLMFFLFFAPIQRFTMLYHYFSALLFAILLFGILMEWVFLRFSRRVFSVVYASVVLLLVAGFMYVMPLSYGIPLAKEERDKRVQVLSWPKMLFPSSVSPFTTP